MILRSVPLGKVEFVYNDDGLLTAWGAPGCAWNDVRYDAAKRVVTAQVRAANERWSFTYDGNRRRVDFAAGASGREFVIDERHAVCVRALEGSEELVRREIDGAGRLVLEQSGCVLRTFVYQPDGRRVETVTRGSTCARRSSDGERK